MIRHAGLVALRVDGRWRGALIEGASGAGKSDLALRCLALGMRLVADDRVVLWTCAGRLFGRAPSALAGLVEARGAGIMPEPVLPLAEVALLVRCADAPEAVERMPHEAPVRLLGRALPQIGLWARESAAPVKLRRALEHLGGGAVRAYVGAPRGA